MATLSEALSQARTLLNDDLATIWSDASLIPKCQIAHQELQVALWEVGSPVVREESGLLSLTLGATDLGVNQPADLLAPTQLFEYNDASAYVGEMTEVNYIPLNVAQAGTLIYWAWREEKIVFLGSTAATKVRVRYRKLIAVPTILTSPIGIAFGELYMGARAAALAAGSVGNADALKLATEMAVTNFTRVLAANRGQQKPVLRP